MPFTPSHAVVALPFLRTRLVPAAIAIGAMTPDLPLFLRGMVPDYAMTHDPAWLAPTVVVALALVVVWRCVLRPATRELLPRAVAARLPEGWDAGAPAAARETFGGGVVGILWLVLSLALGVLSHIAWDLFTHEGRTGEQLFPVLAAQWGPFSGAKWLQHASSALGLVVLAVFAVMWLSRRSPGSVARVLPDAVRAVWWLSLPVALVGASLVALAVEGGFGPDYTPTHLIYGVLVKVAAAWGAATLALAVLVQWRRRVGDGRTSPRPAGHTGGRAGGD
ncbi:DUF4184 domain-containing protein [Microbacterium sp. HMWF026]|uniref:DUF4184 family protein n=1 Tax=Microbacterium sp. HMWF026 TaxID=2056861 RepID=UPI000D39614D|nr:DUF4184 family protein [Microbacterium sp. HMWF026]PTT21155.1 DUF4184 domain-containing protein [Microbacterium sp. HMWF026]